MLTEPQRLSEKGRIAVGSTVEVPRKLARGRSPTREWLQGDASEAGRAYARSGR
jgi:hypothetical protein